MKSLLLSFLFLALTLCASAEIKTVDISMGWVPVDISRQAVSVINTHLNKGWVVKAITITANTVTVILESPQPVLQTDDIFYVRKLTPEEVARYKEGIKKEGK